MKKTRKAKPGAEGPMRPAQDVIDALASPGLGFDRVELHQGATYKDASTVVIVPTRGTVHYKVISAWQGLISPMNQKRAFLFVSGDEVGKAYNHLLEKVLAHPELGKWKYVLTLEDDNLPPPDAHIRLLETLDAHPQIDAVSGIYFTKGELNMPMAYGNPERYRRTGVLDFTPLDIREALRAGQVMEVNGIAMGCALWRMDLFRQISAPWFVTVADMVNGAPQGFTQDLYFCKRAKEAGKNFAVDMRVKVGHLDINTGIVY